MPALFLKHLILERDNSCMVAMQYESFAMVAGVRFLEQDR
jgi:hypothetical protein